MRLFKRKASPHWWATWNDQDGKRHRRSSGVSDRKLAEALVAKWVKEDFLAEHFGKKPEVPFLEALLRYAEAQKRGHPRNFERNTRYCPRHLHERIQGYNLSEILGLDWRNVELEHRRVRFVDTKNGEDRTVRLCDRAFATLASLGPKERGPVFTYCGRPMASVKAAFNTARKGADLRDVRFHDLRHTFASRLVRGGVPLYDVMHLMGHKSLDMVQRYSHLAPDYQKGAIQVLNRLGHDLGTAETRQSATI